MSKNLVMEDAQKETKVFFVLNVKKDMEKLLVNNVKNVLHIEYFYMDFQVYFLKFS